MSSGFFYPTLWKGPSLRKGAPGLFYVVVCFYMKIMYIVFKTVLTLIRRCVVRRLIWVYVVCQCLF